METDSRLHFAVSLVILIALTDIGPTVGQSEANRIRMEDPCAMELQLQQGTRSNNLACPVDQSPIMESRCFNITDVCDGQQFCSNGDDEGQGSPPGIECGTNSTKFACSSTESIEVTQICDGNKDCSRGEDEHFKLCRNKCSGRYYGGCPITRRCQSTNDTATCGDCFPGYVANPNRPRSTSECLPVINVTFESPSYTVTEGSVIRAEFNATCFSSPRHTQTEVCLEIVNNVTVVTNRSMVLLAIRRICSETGVTFTSGDTTGSRACTTIAPFPIDVPIPNPPCQTINLLQRCQGRTEENRQTVTFLRRSTAQVCVSNVIGFCPAENNTFNGTKYVWMRTRAGTTATFTCPNNQSFSVTRPCMACTGGGVWQTFDRQGCGVLTGQLEEILVASRSSSEGDVSRAARRLSELLNASVSYPIDQTRGNLNSTRQVLNNIAKSVRMKRNINNTEIVMAATETVGSLVQWMSSAVEAETSSSVIQSFQMILSVYTERLSRRSTRSFSFRSVRLVTQMSDLEDLREGRSVSINRKNFTIEDGVTITNSSADTPSDTVIPAISLPPLIFQKIDNATSVGLVFTLYDRSTLFPVGRNVKSRFSHRNNMIATRIGSVVIAATVVQEEAMLSLEDLKDPVLVVLPLTTDKKGFLRPGSEVCVSWDFDRNDWTRRGCKTTVGTNGTVLCTCDHLTNFAVIVRVWHPDYVGNCYNTPSSLRDLKAVFKSTKVRSMKVIPSCGVIILDICLRQEDCDPINPVVGAILSFISFIGIVLSLIGLVLTIITMLAFKKIRQKDSTSFHIQLCLSLLLMLTMALVLVAVNSAGGANVLYGGCIFVSVTTHYFTLVSVMWMGAEAVLIFEKLIIVFVTITVKQVVIVSLICWTVPILPVLATLIADQVDPENDIIIRRSETESLCFLSSAGALWGAFLGPILLILTFNLVIFIIVIVVQIRHIRGTIHEVKRKVKAKKVVRLMLSIGGIMAIFGLAWLFAILTASPSGLREISQIIFTVFNSFQGFYIFLFFCVLNKQARDSWKVLFSCVCGRIKKIDSLQSASSLTGKHTTVTSTEMSSSHQSSTSIIKTGHKDLNPTTKTFSTSVPSHTDIKSPVSPSASKPGKILGLDDLPETSTFHISPSKTTFIT